MTMWTDQGPRQWDLLTRGPGGPVCPGEPSRPASPWDRKKKNNNWCLDLQSPCATHHPALAHGGPPPCSCHTHHRAGDPTKTLGPLTPWGAPNPHRACSPRRAIWARQTLTGTREDRTGGITGHRGKQVGHHSHIQVKVTVPHVNPQGSPLRPSPLLGLRGLGGRGDPGEERKDRGLL